MGCAMCSLEVYNEFRGELNRVLAEGDSLMEEDEFLIELISSSKNPRGVLDLAKDMKEAGNLFFKQGSIEDALEKYGYARVILGCFWFEDDDDRVEFFDLAICILLNSAACFGKKMEFEQYRVKRESEKQFRGDVPLGLRLGLPPPKKKSKGDLVKGHSNEQALIYEKDRISVERGVECDGGTGLDNMVVEQGLPIMENKELSDCCSANEEDSMEGGKDEIMDEEAREVASVSKIENSKSVEPNYRFVNRRRPGSSLSISKKDYQLLLRGKSFQYFNSRLGSLMTVRILGGNPESIVMRKCGSQEENVKDSFMGDMSKKSLSVDGKNEVPEKQLESSVMDDSYNKVDSKIGDSKSEAMSTVSMLQTTIIISEE
ncbi:hypothetical protein SOVF_049400 [Spinacia oleracea]|nr:hypothetical protein SOVF_049400 [Spinacia oleracea]